MPKNSEKLKSSFTVDCRIQSFYNGGHVAVTRTGDRLFTNFGNQINCIDLESGKINYVIGAEETENGVSTFSLAPSDDFVIVSYANLLIKQWAISENDSKIDRIWKSGHKNPVVCQAISDNSAIFASGSSDSSVKIWDLQAQYCTHTLKSAAGCITCVNFAPETWNDSNTLIFAYADDLGKIFVRNLKGDQRQLAVLTDSHSSAVTCLLFDDKYLYSCGRDSVVVVHDQHANFTRQKIVPVFESIESMTFIDRPPAQKNDDKKSGGPSSQPDKYFLTVGDSGRLKIWSLSTSRCVYVKDLSISSKLCQILSCDHTRSFFVTNSDQLIFQIDYDDFTVRLQLVGHNDEIYDAAFVTSENGLLDNKVVVATNSKEIRVYDVISQNCQLLLGHTDAVLALDVAAWDNSLLATCSKDNTILVWKNFLRKFVASGHTNSVTSIRFSRLGGSTKKNFLASISDDRTLKVWRIPSEPTENEEISLSATSTVVSHEKDVTAVDIAPNDRILATCSLDKTIKLWNLSATKLQLTAMGVIREHKRGVWDVKFSPSDQVLASCSGDWTVKIFALTDLSCLKTFEGHQATVLRILFASEGLQLMSADSAGLIKLWTIRTNECTKTFDAHDGKVYALNLNSAGDRLVSGGTDAQICIWRDETATERSDADAKRKDIITKEQTLKNLVEKNRYVDAFRLAITLNRPFNVLTLLKRMLSFTETSEGVDKDGKRRTVEFVLRSLSTDELTTLLKYSIEWNTNSRHFLVAQNVLSTILRITPPEKLLKLPNIKEIVEGLLPYSQRHFERLSQKRQQAYFVDYTWQTARLIGDVNERFVIKREMED